MLLYVIKINPLFSLFYAQFITEQKLNEHIYLLDSKDSYSLPWFIIGSVSRRDVRTISNNHSGFTAK